MSQVRHVFRRSTIELKMSRRMDHETIQVHIAALFREHIVPLIGEILDRETTGREDLHLGVLELDLGRISLRYLEEEFIGRVAETFKSKLLEHLPADTAAAGPNPGRKEGEFDQKDLELLTFFLKTGTLPWWADSGKPNALPEAFERLSDEHPAELSLFLQKTASQTVRLKRLVLSVSDDLLLKVLYRAMPKKAGAAGMLLPVLRERLSGVGPKDQLRQALWQAVLVNFKQPEEKEIAAMAGAMLTAAATYTGLSARELAQKCLDFGKQTVQELPPEVLQAVREFADDRPVPAPETLKTNLLLSEILRQLESILAEPGMSLQRLERISPILRDLYHHLNRQSSESGDAKTIALLRSLSRFISPFLDPKNNPPTRKKVHQVQPDSEAKLSHSASDTAILAEMMERIDGQRQATSGEAPVFDSQVLKSLRQEVQRSILKVEALIRELLQDILKSENHPKAEAKTSFKNAAERIRAVLQDLLTETDPEESNQDKNDLSEASPVQFSRETAEQLRQDLLQCQGTLMVRQATPGASSLPLLLKIALENLSETRGDEVHFVGNPAPIAEMIQHPKLEANWPKICSLIDDWIALARSDGGGMPLAAVQKLYQLLDEAVLASEMSLVDSAESRNPERGNWSKTWSESWHGNAISALENVAKSLKRSLSESKAESVAVPQPEIEPVLRLLKTEASFESTNEQSPSANEHSHLADRRRSMSKSYAQAVLTYLAAAGDEGPKKGLRDAVMALSRFLAVAEKEKGRKKNATAAAKNQGAENSGWPSARGSQAEVSSNWQAMPWINYQTGSAADLWTAVRNAIPESARKSFAQLERRWVAEAEAQFAAALLSNATACQSQLAAWDQTLAHAIASRHNFDKKPEANSEESAIQNSAQTGDNPASSSDLSKKSLNIDNQNKTPTSPQANDEDFPDSLIIDSIGKALLIEHPHWPAESTVQDSSKLPASPPPKRKKPNRRNRRQGKNEDAVTADLSNKASTIASSDGIEGLLQSRIKAIRKRLAELTGEPETGTETTPPENTAHEASATQSALIRAALREIDSLLRAVLPADIRAQLQLLQRALKGESNANRKSANIKAFDNIRSGLDHLQKLLKQRLNQGSENDSRHTGRAASEADAVYVGNAGLVLLWPFLGRFFEKLDLMADRQFVSPEAQQKAVLLLQYIANGKTEPQTDESAISDAGPGSSGELHFAEYQLPLCKLLCGYPLDQPLPLSLELDETSANECHALLDVVPAHNPKMKNLSSAGFRSAWLQREGVLKTRDENFVLHVESKPYDILLDHLPWSSNMLKMQWMEGILLVEW